MAVTMVTYTEAWNNAFKTSVIVNLILLKIYTTFNELVTKNTLVKIKTILVLIEGFHLPQRQIIEAATGGLLKEKVFLAISQNSQENTCARRVSFSIKLQASASKREALAQTFLCGFCEVSQNTFFTEHLSDCFRHYEKTEPQSTFLTKLCQPKENPRVGQISKKDVQCFHVQLLHFKLWKINTLPFSEKNKNNNQVTIKLIALARWLIIFKNVFVIKVSECAEGRRTEIRSVWLTESDQNYL